MKTRKTEMFLSIIIPCKNRNKELNALVNNISAQIGNNNDVEIIIVDDCSKSPLRIATRTSVSEIKLVRNKTPCGANISRKRGFLISRGKYIHFHDSDDDFSSNWLKVIRQTISIKGKIDILVTPRNVIQANGECRVQKLPHLNKIFRSPGRLGRSLLFDNVIGPLSGVVFHRSVVSSFTFHDVTASQDWLMYDEAARVSKLFMYTEKTHIIQNQNSRDRISYNSWARVRGYVSTARIRFKKKFLRKLMSRMYCSLATEDVAPLIRVKFPTIKRRVLLFLAGSL